MEKRKNWYIADSELVDTDAGTVTFGSLDDDAKLEIDQEESEENTQLVAAVREGDRQFDEVDLRVKCWVRLQQINDFLCEGGAHIITEATLAVLQEAYDKLRVTYNQLAAQGLADQMDEQS